MISGMGMTERFFFFLPDFNIQVVMLTKDHLKRIGLQGLGDRSVSKAHNVQT